MMVLEKGKGASSSSRAGAPRRFESCAYVGVPGTVDAVHIKLACARRPRYVHRVVVVRGHVQDRVDIVQIAFCHCAVTGGGSKRLQ